MAEVGMAVQQSMHTRVVSRLGIEYILHPSIPLLEMQ